MGIISYIGLQVEDVLEDNDDVKWKKVNQQLEVWKMGDVAPVNLRKRISIELKLDTNENDRRDSRTRASKNYPTMCCSRQQEGAWSVFIIGQFAMKQCMIENNTHRLFIQYAAHHWDARRWQWGWIFSRVSQTPMIGRDDQESFEQNIQGIVWFCAWMSG